MIEGLKHFSLNGEGLFFFERYHTLEVCRIVLGVKKVDGEKFFSFFKP